MSGDVKATFSTSDWLWVTNWQVEQFSFSMTNPQKSLLWKHHLLWFQGCCTSRDVFVFSFPFTKAFLLPSWTWKWNEVRKQEKERFISVNLTVIKRSPTKVNYLCLTEFTVTKDVLHVPALQNGSSEEGITDSCLETILYFKIRTAPIKCILKYVVSK